MTNRPVAFRIRRADADTAGTPLSETDWRYFSNEEDAVNASDALGTEYQGLYARGGPSIVANSNFMFHPRRCVSDETGIDVLWWEPSQNCWFYAGEPVVFQPTHWMPLPAPPSLRTAFVAKSDNDEEIANLAAHLWSAGADHETAQFVATQLIKKEMRLVPNQPDDTMWQAGRAADVAHGDSYTKVYCAMIEAAPRA